MIPNSDQRIAVHTTATLRWQGIDGDGIEANPGTVTVTVTNAAGTALVTDAATSGTGTDPRTYSLSAANNTQLDALTATWKVSGTTVGTTVIEVCGGYYATVGQIRASDSTLQDYDRYPNARIVASRWEAERECEGHVGAAFVPRYRRILLDIYPKYTNSGVQEFQLPDLALRSVRSCVLYRNGLLLHTLTSDELSNIPSDLGGAVRYTILRTVLCVGQQALIEYEHGADAPPADLKREWFGRVRFFLNREKTQMDERALSFTPVEGGTLSLSTPGRGGAITGFPTYDQMLRREAARYRPAGIA